VIGEYIDENGKKLYIGVSVGTLPGDAVVEKYLQVIVNAKNEKLPGKSRKLTGSELLIIEPEYVEWSEGSELYPFIFQSIGDWSVTTSIEPPEGFVADQDQLQGGCVHRLEGGAVHRDGCGNHLGEVEG
jgi:hypothetical protein